MVEQKDSNVLNLYRLISLTYMNNKKHCVCSICSFLALNHELIKVEMLMKVVTSMWNVFQYFFTFINVCLCRYLRKYANR